MPAIDACCQATDDTANPPQSAPTRPQPHKARKPLTEAPAPDVSQAPESVLSVPSHVDPPRPEAPVAAAPLTQPPAAPQPPVQHPDTNVAAQLPSAESSAAESAETQPPAEPESPAEPDQVAEQGANAASPPADASVPAATASPAAPASPVATPAAPNSTGQPSDLDNLFDEPAEAAKPAAGPADAKSEDAKPAAAPKGDTSLDDLFNDASRPSDTSAPIAGGLNSHQLRLWTDVTGHYRCRGRLVRIGTTQVRILKQNGHTTTVARDRLSRQDMAFVRSEAALAAARSDTARLASF